MKITFKKYLFEGGKATAKFHTQRATKSDIEKCLSIVSNTLGIQDLEDRLLGSTENTFKGNKQDSGDIDLVLTFDDIDMSDAHAKMMKLCNNEGSLNKGTKIGSYAVDIGSKKVQVDLMFVSNKEWAKFIYHSAEGNGSNYSGATRNMLLMAVTRNKQEIGKDFIITNGDQLVARASRAVKLDVGLERLFKLAKKNPKTNDFNKGLDKVEPDELQAQVKTIVGRDVKFDPTPDIIDDPDKVVAWMFGSSVKAKDVKTAEQVIAQIKKLSNSAQIIKDAKRILGDAKLEIPMELE